MATFLHMVVCLAISINSVFGEMKVEDLSHVQKPGLTAYPLYPDLNFTISHRGTFKENLWLEFNVFSTVEHYGTHVDAPAHLSKGKWRLHQVPLKQFMGPAVVVDIREKVKKNADAQVTVKDLQDWEEKYGPIPEGAIVLMLSEWDTKFMDEKAYFGTETPENASSYHYPGFHPDSIKWLVENKPTFHGIGVDTISLDYGPSSDFKTHTRLFEVNKIGYENLVNLKTLPMSGAMFYGTPMNLFDGSGCPVRAFAVYDTSSASQKSPATAALASLILTAVCFLRNMV